MAYAAVVSLEQILKQLLDSDPFPIHYPKSQIESLHGNILYLQDFLEKNFPVSKTNKNAVTDLETQVRDSIYEAEDTIEHYISSQGPRDDESYILDLNQKLDEVIQEIDSIKERAADKSKEIGPGHGIVELQTSQIPSNSTSSTKNKPVGLEEDLKRLKDELTGGSSKLDVIPIVGMAGIGKTTLATALYDDLDIERRFDIRAWVTVSQEYTVQDIFSGLLRSMNKLNVKTDDQLADNVYKILKDNRYLVVIDDMWDIKVWDHVRRFLPDDKKGSRIILTTRLINVAKSVNNSNLHEMPFLDNEKSWKLLCEKVFGDGVCPVDLVEIGKEISSSCGGLALAIVVVGGLLSKANKTPSYWRIVADDINSTLDENAEGCTEILSLSYNHLPIHLKGCFLYLGAFPEDHEISISKLVKLWVAEGFLKLPAPPKNLEEVAREFLKDLVDRNLILVRKFSSNGQIKTCRMHDLIRDLCLKEATKEKSFHVINKYVQDFPEGTENQRRISVHKTILMCMKDVYNSTKSIKHPRSLLYVGQYHHHPLPFHLTFELLRVLDALSVYYIEFPSEVVKLIHLRYLSFTYNGKLPASIAQLQNLRILIVRQHPKIIFTGISILPVEIWSMPKLRHIQFTESDFPDPSSAEIHAQDSVLLENLQTLSNVNAYCCTKAVLSHIPNLKKLGMWIEAPDVVPFNLDELQQLEAFKFTVLNPIPGSIVVFQPEFFFPSTIKKVSLSGCGIPWEDISILGNLPNLEVLKLREFAFQGPEWEPVDDEFLELKFLLLEYMDLVSWKANESHFPSLESLIFKHCYELEEIPSEIGNMGSLQLLEVVDCNPPVAASAQKIQEEQKKLKNESLQVRVYSSWE